MADHLEESGPFSRGTQRLAIWMTLAAVLGYLLFTFWGGWREVLQAFQDVGIDVLVLALALSLLNYFLRFLRWQLLLGQVGMQIRWGLSARIYMSGFALTVTPGKAGEAVRSVFLRRLGMRYRESLALLLADRVMDALAVVLLAALGLWTYEAARPWVVASFLSFFGFVLIAKIIASRLGEEAPKGKLLSWIRDLLLAFHACLTWRQFIFGMFLGVIAWGAEGLAFFLIVKALGYSVGYLWAQFAYAFAILVGALSFFPGGLGSCEFVLFQLMQLQGISAPAAIGASLVIRFTTLWFAVILGIISFPRNLERDPARE